MRRQLSLRTTNKMKIMKYMEWIESLPAKTRMHLANDMLAAYSDGVKNGVMACQDALNLMAEHGNVNSDYTEKHWKSVQKSMLEASAALDIIGNAHKAP